MSNDMISNVNQQLNQGIADAHGAVESDASLDLTDPENQAKLQQDMFNYTTMMQTQASIQEALHNLCKTIAQSIGQA